MNITKIILPRPDYVLLVYILVMFELTQILKWFSISQHLNVPNEFTNYDQKYIMKLFLVPLIGKLINNDMFEQRAQRHNGEFIQ